MSAMTLARLQTLHGALATLSATGCVMATGPPRNLVARITIDVSRITLRKKKIMHKQSIKLASVAPKSDNHPDGGVTEDKPVTSANTDEAIKFAGENNTPSHDTPAKVPNAVPKSTPKKASLPIHDDYELSQEMLNSVEQQAKMSIPRMERGARYTAKQICGKAFWKMLSRGDKIVAGICMSRLVKTNRLPLIEAGSNASHAKVYELK